ncbi:hypothetical protein Tsubulata_030608 [Turnera subulata]|uniref:tRNA pseudouridine synthase n=1 Tax=Turnera subulata TaxID=218843 RepID=A0A9Q0GKE0_9ROSI|nr:hypothetical protein Tsubulata_030608 [Turnera subulata]
MEETTTNHPLPESSSSPSERPLKIPKTQPQLERDRNEEEQEEGEEERVESSSFVDKPMASPRNPRLQRYLVAVEYIGSRFSGSQKQLSARTVVGVLEEAFHKFIGQPVSISLSSRTDAGVHALSNVCHVDVERISKRKPNEVLPPHEPSVVRKAVNHFLQKNEGDITVVDVRSIPPDFHARFRAQERTYFYRLLSGPEPPSTFEKDRAWHVPEDLNLVAMQEACEVLVGHHDFSSFRASGCQAKSPIRTLDQLSVSEMVPTPNFPSTMTKAESNAHGEDPHSCCSKSSTVSPIESTLVERTAVGSDDGSDLGFGIRRQHRCFVVTARARSFLYHQVRLLVGVIKAAGIGDLTVSDVERILNAKSISATPPMAPAHGLYLGHVKYDFP